MKCTASYQLAIAVAMTLCSCGGHSNHSNQQDHADLPVAEVAVKAINPARQLSFEQISGTVESEQVAVLESKVSGTVSEVKVRPGQQVQAGTPVITLTAHEVGARRNQAAAQFERAESEFEKFQTLLDSQAVSRLDFERVKGEYERSRAALEEAETLLSYTTLYAPFDGIVARRMVDPGSQATPGKALLTIEDSTRLQFASQVPEALVQGIKVGDTLQVTIDSTGNQTDGEIIEVAPSADPASRTFLVKLRLLDSPGLRSGLFGRVSIPAAEVQLLTVPQVALVQRGQMEILFIAEHDKAKLRLVRSGRRWPDRVEIVSGLEAGERVVIAGGERLRDGQPLNIVP